MKYKKSSAERKDKSGDVKKKMNGEKRGMVMRENGTEKK